MKSSLRRVLLLAAMLCILLLIGCNKQQESKNEDIVVLYTNDVHCGVEDNIGFSSLSAYKAKMQEQTPYVTLVDCGDAIQGDLMGTVSKGEYIVNMMNDVPYDYGILGNHEFDYGLEQLSHLIDVAKFKYLGCNLAYTGDGEDTLKNLEPYAIAKYGDKSVAFIGVSTPYSITSSTPKYFMDENGKIVYSFYSDNSDMFYGRVQEFVDKARKEGADYVVLLTHLGDSEEFAPYSSVDLINNTTGVDVVLDGHAHTVMPSNVEKNKDGQDVLLSSTGTKMANIGKLVITKDGTIVTSLISKYADKNPKVDEAINAIKSKYDEEVNRVVATSDTALSVADASGVRMVRNRETSIGDFCADAYRAMSGADIAFVNGGGIREDLPKGDVTYADVLKVHPFGNSLCMVEATGQEIMDALEWGCRFTEAEYAENGQAKGESGGFLQVSGLKYTIDTSVSTTTTQDENGMFNGVDGKYRVCDVEVMNQDGKYEPLDLKKTYTVASHNYTIKDNGDGCSMFSDNKLLIDEGMADYQMLISYIQENLSGKLGDYAQPAGRITIK